MRNFKNAPNALLSPFLVGPCFIYAYLQYAVGQNFDRFCVWRPFDQKWHCAIFESCVFLQNPLFLENTSFGQRILSCTGHGSVWEKKALSDFRFRLPLIGEKNCILKINSASGIVILEIGNIHVWPLPFCDTSGIACNGRVVVLDAHVWKSQ